MPNRNFCTRAPSQLSSSVNRRKLMTYLRDIILTFAICLLYV